MDRVDPKFYSIIQFMTSWKGRISSQLTASTDL